MFDDASENYFRLFLKIVGQNGVPVTLYYV
jgi:hypothetical protein